MRKYNIIIAIITLIIIQLVFAISLYLDIVRLNEVTLNDIQLDKLIGTNILIKTVLLVLLLGIIALTVNKCVSIFREYRQIEATKLKIEEAIKNAPILNRHQVENKDEVDEAWAEVFKDVNKMDFGAKDPATKPRRFEYSLDKEGQEEYDKDVKLHNSTINFPNPVVRLKPQRTMFKMDNEGWEEYIKAMKDWDKWNKK